MRKINLPSNAYYTERIVPAVEKILQIHKGCFLNLGLSLHALEGKHDEITGVPGSFEHVMETYRALQPLRRRYSNLGLSIPVINCGDNEHDVRELLTYIFREMDIDDICINLVRGKPRMEDVGRFSVEQYKANCLFLQSLIHQHGNYYFNMPFRGFYVSKDIVLRELIWRTLKTKAFQIPCYAGGISAVIDETGDVYPCELRHDSFGNLRDAGYDFRRIWKGAARKRLLQEIKSKKCFCTHECSNTTNILFNLRVYPRLFTAWCKLLRDGWGIVPHGGKESRREGT